MSQTGNWQFSDVLCFIASNPRRCPACFYSSSAVTDTTICQLRPGQNIMCVFQVSRSYLCFSPCFCSDPKYFIKKTGQNIVKYTEKYLKLHVHKIHTRI